MAHAGHVPASGSQEAGTRQDEDTRVTDPQEKPLGISLPGRPNFLAVVTAGFWRKYAPFV